MKCVARSASPHINKPSLVHHPRPPPVSPSRPRHFPELPDVRTSTPVASVVRRDGGVIITTAAGHVERYDDVVFATHSNITRKLLGDDAAEEEAAMLESIPYSDNDVYLHTGMCA